MRVRLAAVLLLLTATSADAQPLPWLSELETINDLPTSASSVQLLVEDTKNDPFSRQMDSDGSNPSGNLGAQPLLEALFTQDHAFQNLTGSVPFEIVLTR